MLPLLRFRSCVFLVVVLSLVVSIPTSGDTDASSAGAARWKDGELLAPLPADPQARAEAIARAKAWGESRVIHRTAKSVTYTSSPTNAPVVLPVRAPGHVAGAPRPETTPAQTAWLQSLRDRLDNAAPKSDGRIEAASPSNVQALAESDVSPTISLNSFDGIDDTGLDPGAPDIAVGPEHILLATTDRFSIMDKCGGTLMTSLFRTFFGQPATRSYYTPKVIYDTWTPRWIMLYIGTELDNSNNYLYVAVSETVDPLGAWYHYPIPTALLAGLKDGLSIAVTPETIYIAYNQFNLSTFAFERAVILELVKDDVYNQEAVTLFNHAGMTNPNDATVAFGVHAADLRTYGGTMYFVNNKPGGDDFFTMWELTGDPGASVLTGTDVGVSPYLPPPDMPQPNATLVDAGDNRIRDAVYSSGQLYAAYGRENVGRATVETRRIDVDDLSQDGVYLSGLNGFAYPAIEVDENDHLILSHCKTGAATFLSVEYYILSLPVFVHDSGILGAGLANFSSGSSPYRWGPYMGVALDPADGRTAWIHGPYASNAPLNSWTTRVGAVSGFAASSIDVAAPGGTYVFGFEGGPFNPEQIDVELTNTGATTANWNIDIVPAWLSVAATSGSLDPGESQVLSFFVNGAADGYSQGTYPSNLIFVNCTGTVGGFVPVTLAVGLDGTCSGAQLALAPPVASAGASVDLALTQLGAYVTAIRDLSICAIGIEAGPSFPQNVIANIYAADGNTRGALLYTSLSFLLAGGVYGLHVIPIDADLLACGEYDISVEFGAPVGWSYWADPASGVAPFDAGGLVRVRNAEVNGNAADTRLPRIVLFTTTGTCANITDLNAGAGSGGSFTANDARGLFINPEKTMRLCSVGISGGFVEGTRLMARVYKTTGAVRTALLTQGMLTVSTSDFTFHDVPVSQILLSGSQYDVEVQWEDTGAWSRYMSPPAILPYTVDNAVTVYGAEHFGAVTGVIPHLRFNWSDVPPGTPFDLAKLSGPTPTPLASMGSLAHGAYITSLIDQEVYSVGVMADVPDEGFITAYVYQATGTTRGALISTASMKSYGSGMRWHDVPVSASFVAGGEYDIQFGAPAVTEWPYWNDSPGLPYESYGIIRVRDAEASGVIGTSFLAHMRVHGCNSTATDVADGPVRVPMMLDPPAPNPSTGMVRFGYAVDEAGDVHVEVYDVSGRRVANVARKRATKIGRDAVDFDTSKLASGVYFVKLTTKTKSTSRKFVVTH